VFGKIGGEKLFGPIGIRPRRPRRNIDEAIFPQA
jgi:hypothetical protein